MNEKMESNAEYMLLNTEEDTIYSSAPLKGDSSWYPGMRRVPIVAVPPPADTVLVNTGGNALQAVPSNLLKHDTMVTVIVPEGVISGDTLFVSTPDGRLLETTVPEGAFPGHAFMVEATPVEHSLQLQDITNEGAPKLHFANLI